MHRNSDLPAVITKLGTKRYYQNNILHRENDRPAVIKFDGCEEWYQHGLVHRDNDQPAVIDEDIKCWYKYGKRHRESRDVNGKLNPAVIYNYDTYRMYYLDDYLVDSVTRSF